MAQIRFLEFHHGLEKSIKRLHLEKLLKRSLPSVRYVQNVLRFMKKSNHYCYSFNKDSSY